MCMYVYIYIALTYVQLIPQPTIVRSAQGSAHDDRAQC